jgi:hypothetical protein
LHLAVHFHLAVDKFMCVVDMEDGNSLLAEHFSSLLELDKELKCLIMQFHKGEAYEAGKTINK